MTIRKPLQVVFFSPLPWDELQKNGYRKTCGAMFKALRERSDVTRIWLVEFERSWGFHLRRQSVDEKVEVLGLPICLPFERFAPIRYFNRGLQAWLLTRFLQSERNIGLLVYWFYDWWPIEWVARLPIGVRVMEITDAVEQFVPQETPFIKRLNTIRQQALRSVDLNVVVTPTLADDIKGALGITRVYPNAIDPDFLQLASIPQEEPADLQGLPRPRLCVVGTGWSLNYRTDHELLNNVLRLLPDWHLVLVGCEYVRSPGLVNLTNSKNVIAIKLVPRNRLIAYLQHCDVTAIPYLNTEQRKSIGNTIKILDYLCCQKPVVSTTQEDNPLLQPYIHFAPDSFSFASACRMIASSITPIDLDRLNKVLIQMTWDRRVEQCVETIYTIDSIKNS